MTQDDLFPMWEHLLNKVNRQVGVNEVVRNSEQNSLVSRDFRNSLDVNHHLELRIEIFRSYLEEKVKIHWPNATVKNNVQCTIQEYDLATPLSNLETIYANQKHLDSATKDTQLGSGDYIVLIGAITKRQRIHPYEAHMMCKKIGILPLPMQKACFGDDNEDSLYLTDHTSKIKLTIPNRKLLPGEVVSGIVCAVKGSIIRRRFIVEDIMFPTPSVPLWPKVSESHNIEMVFISGLNIGKIADDFVYRNLLMEYLQGMTGIPAEQEHIVKPKTRVFILGNSFHRQRKKNDATSLSAQVETAKLVDDFISQLADTMEVFLLPGENDPSSTPLLPQPPIHSMILPKSKHNLNFRRLSNPANVKVSVTDGTRNDHIPLTSVTDKESINLLLSSGKNVKDAMQACNIKCPIKMTKKLLEWSHMNPTSPQVIPLCGGSSEDFFCLKGKLPHLCVIGNQSTYGVEHWNSVKIVSVPDFEKTSTVAFLSWELNVHPMNFKIMF